MYTALARKNQTPKRSPAPVAARAHSSIRNILRGPSIQPKLKIGAANDPAEAEADRVADRVMRMGSPVADQGSAAPSPRLDSGPNPIRRMCEGCEDELQRMTTGEGGEVEDEELVQPKEKPGATPALSTASEGAIRGLGGGAPLAQSERSFFEPRFGQDFSNVRVHSDAAADTSARSINARAYTLGSDIAFARGEYSPGAPSGRRLLAHELVHIVQDAPAERMGTRLGTASEGASLKVRRSTGDGLQVGALAGGLLGAGIGAYAGGPIGALIGGGIGALIGGGIGAAIGAAAGGATCPAANKATIKKACIQPIVIAKDDGTDPTTAPSMDKVKSIWKKCCIDYSDVKKTKTVNKTSFQILDESKTNTPTAEASALFKKAGTSTCIQVFVPRNFRQDGKTSKTISGGAANYGRGTANPKVVVLEGAVAEVVAHEAGHASGFPGHIGHGGTVMKPSGSHTVANPTSVSANVCQKARTGAVLKDKSSAKECCQDFT